MVSRTTVTFSASSATSEVVATDVVEIGDVETEVEELEGTCSEVDELETSEFLAVVFDLSTGFGVDFLATTPDFAFFALELERAEPVPLASA